MLFKMICPHFNEVFKKFLRCLFIGQRKKIRFHRTVQKNSVGSLSEPSVDVNLSFSRTSISKSFF